MPESDKDAAFKGTVLVKAMEVLAYALFLIGFGIYLGKSFPSVLGRLGWAIAGIGVFLNFFAKKVKDYHQN